ncbi:Aldose reductase, partial [Gonapodya sp. JEL0774]
MALPTTIKLSTGAEMPTFGLGTWLAAPGVVEEAVKVAIEAGYRHIENEAEIGAALQSLFDRGVVRREDVFYTSKLYNTFHRADLVKKACKHTLNVMGLDYLDLYLVHWPISFQPQDDLSILLPRGEDGNVIVDHSIKIEDYWPAMEDLYTSGLVRAIGVSNFSIVQIQHLLTFCKVRPVVNQIEMHPYLPQTELIEYCKTEGIVCTAYTPFGRVEEPKLMEDPV